jgi:hypothetical protein
MSDLTFHYADEYVQRGYSVIPLIGKTPPAGFRWSRYQRRRAALSEIREWFGPGSRRRFNIGIVTGSLSALTVVDLDSAADVQWWRDNFPATPLVAVTGRGGAHMYYRAAETSSVRNQARVLGRKLDLRGEGGYVVAPPSRHPDTGRPYHWQRWPSYSLAQIPRFDPAWLPTREDGSAPSRNGDPTHRSATSHPIIRDGPAYIAHIHAISGRGGHNATFRAACSLREAGMTPAQALDALLAWNETNCQPKWTTRELAHKIADAYGRDGS